MTYQEIVWSGHKKPPLQTIELDAGGYYGSSSSDETYAAFRRGNDPTVPFSIYSSRSHFYIK